MIYQRSYTIEQRLESLLCLIRGGRHTAATLAEALGVSVPTVSRSLVPRCGTAATTSRPPETPRAVTTASSKTPSARPRGENPPGASMRAS